MSKKFYIYLIQQQGSDLYKIGYSHNPSHRLEQLQTANGVKLELIETFRTDYKTKLEKLLHKKFFKQQTLGEWFELSQEQVREFKNVCKVQENYFKVLEENNTYIQDRGKW